MLKINSYIEEKYPAIALESIRLQKEAKERIQDLIAILKEKAIIEHMLKKMKESPIHELVDALLYHDLVMLKETIYKSYQRIAQMEKST